MWRRSDRRGPTGTDREGERQRPRRKRRWPQASCSSSSFCRFSLQMSFEASVRWLAHGQAWLKRFHSRPTVRPPVRLPRPSAHPPALTPIPQLIHPKAHLRPHSFLRAATGGQEAAGGAAPLEPAPAPPPPLSGIVGFRQHKRDFCPPVQHPRTANRNEIAAWTPLPQRSQRRASEGGAGPSGPGTGGGYFWLGCILLPPAAKLVAPSGEPSMLVQLCLLGLLPGDLLVARRPEARVLARLADTLLKAASAVGRAGFRTSSIRRVASLRTCDKAGRVGRGRDAATFEIEGVIGVLRQKACGASRRRHLIGRRSDA